jgi:polysaccharide export outer membrane protein
VKGFTSSSSSQFAHLPSAVKLMALSVIVLSLGCQSKDEMGVAPPPRLPAKMAVAERANSQAFRVGDRVELLVEEDASFNSAFEVREGGYILIPKVGRIPVVGLSREECEKRITEQLKKEQLKEATVYVERRPGPLSETVGGSAVAGEQRMTVFITGGVNRPGQHRVPMGSNGQAPGVFEVILITGGLAKFGDETKVKIMRLDEQGVRRPSVVNVRRVREGAMRDVAVGDGDIIEVPEKVFGF